MFKFAISIFFVLFSTCSLASAASYDFQITGGLVKTSGGFTGGGIGDFVPSGTFTATFTDTTVIFSNISVASVPSDFLAVLFFDGINRGGNLSGDTGPYTNRRGRATYSGSFDGNRLSLVGQYQAPCCDQINFQYNLTAQVSWNWP